MKKFFAFIKNTIIEVKAVKYISRRNVFNNTLQITIFLIVSVSAIVIIDSLIQTVRQFIIFI